MLAHISREGRARSVLSARGAEPCYIWRTPEGESRSCNKGRIKVFSTESEKIRPEKLKRIGRRMLVTVGVSAACAYVLGIVTLAGRFQANTSVNDVEVSHMTAEEAEEVYRSTYEDWKLKVRTIEGNEEIIDGDDIDFSLSMSPTFKQMVNRQMFILWPLTPYKNTKIRSNGSAVFDKKKLLSAIDGLNCVSGDDIRSPENAHIERSEEGYYVLEEADDGNTLNMEKTRAAIIKAIEDGKTEIDLNEAGCYEKATLYADDATLQKQFAPIDDFQQTVIKINMKGGADETVSKKTYGSWLDFDPKTGKIDVDPEKVHDYVVKLYNAYSTLGHKRQFRANAGDIVEVGGSAYDNFGYELNLAGTEAAIMDAVKSGTSKEIECSWEQLGLERNELGSDFGNTYIEISLDEQRMWYYIDGETVVDTSIVSGLATQRRSTPCGCFQVLDQLRNHTMEGSYGSAYANYVIAIMDNGICIHDSSWRGEYGGDIWLYDGSHGCINTPYYAVQKLYNNVWTGVPVIIYDRAHTVPEVESYYG